MAERTALEKAFAKLTLLAEAYGITLDDLIEMMNSGASVSDIVVALNPPCASACVTDALVRFEPLHDLAALWIIAPSVV